MILDVAIRPCNVRGGEKEGGVGSGGAILAVCVRVWWV